MSEAIIAKIKASGLSRVEMLRLRQNAEPKAKNGDVIAEAIIEAIDTTAVPKLEAEYVFMGFCPGADFENRRDLEWFEKGICTFDYVQSEVQMRRFSKIMSGDTIILKKRESFGKTMRLFGHGVVTARRDRKIDGLRYLTVNWSQQREILEVPLMACNSTVDIRSLGVVEAKLHPDFWKWLGSDKPTQARA